VFEGTHPGCLVEVAELYRREGDAARAEDLIECAETASDISDVTRVEALLVRARLLEEGGDPQALLRAWQDILAHPHATSGEKEMARHHEAQAERAPISR